VLGISYLFVGCGKGISGDNKLLQIKLLGVSNLGYVIT